MDWELGGLRMRVFSLAILLTACRCTIAIGAEAVTDQQWGETRCDLVAQENREPCMAAHARLGIVPDRTLASVTTSATASTSPADAHSTDTPEVARAKALVADRMKDPSSVMFKDVVYIKERLSVCGSVNAKSGYGGYGGYQRFVVGPAGEVEILDGGTECYGSDKVACYTRKLAGIQAIKENCSATPERLLPDDPKEARKRAGELGDEDGAMSWKMQDDVMKWIERNQASTDAEFVKTMADLCGLMSDRGTGSAVLRLAAVEKSAASRKVRSECEDAREEVESRD